LATKIRNALKRIVVETLGVGVALACILWVLGHLVAFHFFGYILVGESNKLILFSEVALVTTGLLCFLRDLFLRKNSKS